MYIIKKAVSIVYIIIHKLNPDWSIILTISNWKDNTHTPTFQLLEAAIHQLFFAYMHDVILKCLSHNCK